MVKYRARVSVSQGHTYTQRFTQYPTPWGVRWKSRAFSFLIKILETALRYADDPIQFVVTHLDKNVGKSKHGEFP